MSNSFNQVRPGEVISSDLINYVLDQLGSLEERVANLEEGGGVSDQVQITGFNPPNQVEAGQIMSILGFNFAFPPSNNVVTIGTSTTVSSFRPDSTSQELKFVVPTSLDVPTGGSNYRIRVSNSRGEDEKLYRILPGVEAPGDPPAITGVEAADGGPFIFVNQDIRISGQNFAADPEENIITFTISTAGGDVVYPQPGESLNINTGESDTEQIVVTVPDIEEIVSGAGNTPVTLEVGVGAHVPDAQVIQVRRA